MSDIEIKDHPDQQSKMQKLEEIALSVKSKMTEVSEAKHELRYVMSMKQRTEHSSLLIVSCNMENASQLYEPPKKWRTIIGILMKKEQVLDPISAFSMLARICDSEKSIYYEIVDSVVNYYV